MKKLFYLFGGIFFTLTILCFLKKPFQGELPIFLFPEQHSSVGFQRIKTYVLWSDPRPEYEQTAYNFSSYSHTQPPQKSTAQNEIVECFQKNIRKLNTQVILSNNTLPFPVHPTLSIQKTIHPFLIHKNKTRFPYSSDISFYTKTGTNHLTVHIQ